MPASPLKMLIVGRCTVAATHLFTPRLVARIFRLESQGTPAIAYGRMFAIRNALLAAGLAKLGNLRSPRTFVKANVLIDAVDAVALIAAGRRKELSTTSAMLATTVALSAVAMGTAVLLDTPERSEEGH
jgi:hypothetical protein